TKVENNYSQYMVCNNIVDENLDVSENKFIILVKANIDATKIKDELGWVPSETFESGMEKTIDWYLKNQNWCDDVQSGNYHRDRLGVIK
ncbi:MAG: hypothetical protein ABGY96_03580, partial [bacterium]